MIVFALGVLILLGLGAVVVTLVARNRATGSREGLLAPAGSGPAAPVGGVPSTWFWGKLHMRGRPKAFGYYYSDRMAGPSFHGIVELKNAMTDDDVRRAAEACAYRGSTTTRLGGHETVNVPPGLPADFATMLRRKYEECDSPTGTVVLRLSDAERAALGLPDAPPWISAYL